MPTELNTGAMYDPSEFIDWRLPYERVGYTGSRKGHTQWQDAALRILIGCLGRLKEWHHGVCVGGDEKGHFLLRELRGHHQYLGAGRDVTVGPQIHGWPPTKQGLMSQRAFADLDVTHDARDYKARDREIPWHTQALISCPDTDWERSDSGTYYTTRVALAMRRPIYLIRPSDGFVVTEWATEMNAELQDREYEMLVRHFAGRGMELPKPFYREGPLAFRNKQLRDAGLPTIALDETLPDDTLRVAPIVREFERGRIRFEPSVVDPLDEVFDIGTTDPDPLDEVFG
jgi:hypothetical protein